MYQFELVCFGVAGGEDEVGEGKRREAAGKKKVKEG